jgi:hypothetical protein
MRLAKFAVIGAVVFTSGASLAQQDITGTLTLIDRIERNVVILRTQNGTVGASGGAREMLKVPAGFSLDDLHVGNKVSYATTETGGIKTVTKLVKQK